MVNDLVACNNDASRFVQSRRRSFPEKKGFFPPCIFNNLDPWGRPREREKRDSEFGRRTRGFCPWMHSAIYARLSLLKKRRLPPPPLQKKSDKWTFKSPISRVREEC